MKRDRLRALAPKIFILLFLLVSVLGSKAQTAPVKQRAFDSTAIENFKHSAEFTYDVKQPEQLDLFSLILYYLGRLLNKVFSADQQGSFWKIVFYLLMIGSVLLIVLNLMGVDIRRVFGRTPTSAIPYRVSEENIKEINPDELIARAYASGDWRLCIRYHYLKALRLLTDKGLIDWKPGKTNMDYYYELRGAELKQFFLNVTGDFENAWYGHLPVTPEAYETTKGAFEHFYGQIREQRN